jgi:hypothetical protein
MSRVPCVVKSCIVLSSLVLCCVVLSYLVLCCFMLSSVGLCCLLLACVLLCCLGVCCLVISSGFLSYLVFCLELSWRVLRVCVCANLNPNPNQKKRQAAQHARPLFPPILISYVVKASCRHSPISFQALHQYTYTGLL